MARRMLINAQRAQELRLAIVDGATLEDYQLSVAEADSIRGNIYRGIVTSLQPALGAAFVDIGLERNGMLPMHDIVPQAWHREPRSHSRITVDQVLEVGKPVLVQVARDPSEGKGPLLTTNVSLAGRYLVLLPYGEIRGISRKVEENAERQRIREILEKIKLPEGFGLIARTAYKGQPKQLLNRDLNALLRLWKRIRRDFRSAKKPALLYDDQDLIVEAVRDYLDPSIDEVIVDDEQAYKRVMAALRAFMPRSRVKVVHYKEKLPLFSRFHLEKQIEAIFRPRVELPSGGYLVIEATEALTAIDVNSGSSTSAASEEETAFRTNLEAVREVARQLRLRDIGGLVVVDLIDMRSARHRREVERVLREAVKHDRAQVDVGRISRHGLLEISRQRLKPPLVQRTHRTCPTCGGTGRIPSKEHVCVGLLRTIEERAAQGTVSGVKIRLHPELADFFQNAYRSEIAALERELGIKVEIQAAVGFHRSDQELKWIPGKKPSE